MNRRIVLPFFAFLCLTLSAVAADPDRGWFGVGLKVEAPGFSLNPIVRSITITRVTPDSPAAGQGIAEGDEVIEAEGQKITGSKGRELKALMQKPVGQTLHLRLRRPNGEIYAATPTAVRWPPKP